MITGHYEIDFVSPLDGVRRDLCLSADVEVHHSDLFYVVKNIRRKGGKVSLLPDMTIKKLKSGWVHTDSEKDTQLSKAAGKAIEAVCKQPIQPLSGKDSISPINVANDNRE
jgi:hypothetical protein